jgi:hypothetical protein
MPLKCVSRLLTILKKNSSDGLSEGYYAGKLVIALECSQRL